MKTKIHIPSVYRSLIVLLILFSCCNCFAQQREIDSTLFALNNYKKDDTGKVNILLYLSSLYQTLNLEKAAGYAGQAKDLAEKTGNKYFIAMTIDRVAGVDTWTDKTTEALLGYLKEADIAKSINSNQLLQNAYDGIAYVYELEEDWDKSLQYAFTSMEIARKSTDPADVGFPTHQLGSAYFGKGDYIKAEQYLKRAQAIFTSSGDTDRIALCHVDLAKVYINLKFYNIARPHLDTALRLFKIWDEPYQVAETYHQLGMLTFKQNLYDEAEQYFTSELAIYDQYPGAPADHAHAAIGIGRVKIARGDYNRAIEILTTELEALQDAGDMERQLECLEYLAVADSAKNDFKSAFLVMQQFRQLNKVVINAKKDRATERMRIELGIERQNSENKILQTRYDEQQSRLIIIFVAVILLLAVLVFLVLMYRQKSAAFKAVEKLQEETARKNREMASTNNVKDKLISMIAHDVRSPLASIQNTLTLTREGILNTGEFVQMSQMLEMDIQHLMGMLDNTLLWAREQMIDINVKKTFFNLNSLISGVMELYQQTISSKGVIIHNNINAKTEVYSDFDIISTVMRNVLSNAVKFTPQGKSIYLQQSNTKNKVLLTISDEGVGISDDILKKINNREFVSTRGTDNEKGTGLGLLFSRDLLLKLGEDFQISSVPGKGSAITISLGTHE
ncbi:MAG TPA: tetratricopeptide repeat protein [Chitinophagaceae bacterium]|nr:tetratricopeptide repeat protein [Chitinophagaceae bacterium]